MSLAAELYDDLVALGEEPQKARLLRIVVEKLDDRIPRDVARSHEIRESELRLQKEIRELEIRLQKEMGDIRKEMGSIEVRLSQLIHRQAWTIIGGFTTIAAVFRILMHFGF